MGEPETFGRYQLLRVVGTGGMAQVHLARQIGPERFVKPCVLKRISKDQLSNTVVHSLFLEEARVSALFNHPNIVTTFDFGTVSGVPFMAMELVDGVNLAQLCRSLAGRGRWLAIGPAVEILLAVLDALEYAHTLSDLDGRPLNLVHRDVSPQNVLLSRRGQVKLADFGIARHDQRELKTVGPTTKGKPGYMAPEQAMGSEVDQRADLYAVGIMLTELISARRVIHAKDRVAVHRIQDRVRELCALRSDAPQALVDVAIALTSLEPDRRPASARATAQMVRSAAHGLPLDTLAEVLQGVFGAFFPVGAKSDEPSMSPPPPELGAMMDATEIMPAPPPGMPEPSAEPPASAWGVSEGGSGVGAAYDGWPADLFGAPERSGSKSGDLGHRPLTLPPAHPEQPVKAPPAAPPAPDQNIEVMHRSSGVDAMQFFPVQYSDEAKARGTKDAVNEGGTRSGGKKLPLPIASVAIEQAIAAAQEAGEVGGLDAVRKKRALAPVIPLAGAALAVLLVSLGVVAAFALRSPDQVVVHKTGTIQVSSLPPGAAIWLDGKPTEMKTPAALEGVSSGTQHRVTVVLPGHLTVPKEALLMLQPQVSTNVGFQLKAGLSFPIVSEPPDALLDVNGKRLSAVTPATLEVTPFGRTTTVTVSLDGYLPTELRLKAVARTATIAQVKLKHGKSVDVATTPPGADVKIDARVLGKSPLYDVLVPADGSFTLFASKRGYRPFKEKMAAKKLSSPIEIELKELPFLAMPMAPEERKEAKALDLKLNKLEADRRRTDQKLKQAEAKLESVEGSRQNFVGNIADVQRAVDELRAHLDEVESQINETESAIDSMRVTLQERMEREE